MRRKKSQGSWVWDGDPVEPLTRAPGQALLDSAPRDLGRWAASRGDCSGARHPQPGVARARPISTSLHSFRSTGRAPARRPERRKGATWRAAPRWGLELPFSGTRPAS